MLAGKLFTEKGSLTFTDTGTLSSCANVGLAGDLGFWILFRRPSWWTQVSAQGRARTWGTAFSSSQCRRSCPFQLQQLLLNVQPPSVPAQRPV